MSLEISYRTGNQLDIDQVIELYIESTLGERRPVHDRACITQMLAAANLVISAWHGERLVGIARSLTDFCYCAYLADLSVHQDYQRQGIGKQLVARTQQALGPDALLVLLAAPTATEYYPKIGMQMHSSAWILRPGQTLTE